MRTDRRLKNASSRTWAESRIRPLHSLTAALQPTVPRGVLVASSTLLPAATCRPVHRTRGASRPGQAGLYCPARSTAAPGRRSRPPTTQSRHRSREAVRVAMSAISRTSHSARPDRGNQTAATRTQTHTTTWRPSKHEGYAVLELVKDASPTLAPLRGSLRSSLTRPPRGVPRDRGEGRRDGWRQSRSPRGGSGLGTLPARREHPRVPRTAMSRRDARAYGDAFAAFAATELCAARAAGCARGRRAPCAPRPRYRGGPEGRHNRSRTSVARTSWGLPLGSRSTRSRAFRPWTLAHARRLRPEAGLPARPPRRARHRRGDSAKTGPANSPAAARHDPTTGPPRAAYRAMVRRRPRCRSPPAARPGQAPCAIVRPRYGGGRPTLGSAVGAARLRPKPVGNCATVEPRLVPGTPDMSDAIGPNLGPHDVSPSGLAPSWQRRDGRIRGQPGCGHDAIRGRVDRERPSDNSSAATTCPCSPPVKPSHRWHHGPGYRCPPSQGAAGWRWLVRAGHRNTSRPARRLGRPAGRVLCFDGFPEGTPSVQADPLGWELRVARFGRTSRPPPRLPNSKGKRSP
jgi:hypothetical protein